MFKQVLATSALISAAFAAYTNDTVITTDITVTDYVTYCPESTVITITKCEEVCSPTVITVTEATTLTVTGECLVPTTYTTKEEPAETTPVPAPSTVAGPSTVIEESTVAAESTAVISSFEGAANKVAVGALAGVAAIAALI